MAGEEVKTRENETELKQANTVAVSKDNLFVLDEKIGIQSIGNLVEQLSVAFDGSSNVVIDANAVRSIDIAALQVLVAFANSAFGSSSNVEWRSDNGILRQYAELADLSQYLQFISNPVDAEGDGLCPVF